PLFRRNREDFAARFEYGSGAGWRNRAVLNLVFYFLVMRARRRQVSGNSNAELFRFPTRRIKQKNPSKLFVGERVRPPRKRLEIKSFVLDHLLHRLRLRVIRKERHRTVAVGKK